MFLKIYIDEQKKAKTERMSYRTLLQAELEKRMCHNQHEINSAKNTIGKLLAAKYTEEHLSILKKLIGHCTRKSKEEILAHSNLQCPRDILRTDILKHVNRDWDPRLMTEEDSVRFRELLND